MRLLRRRLLAGLLAAALLVPLVPGRAAAQAGALDPTFDADGIVVTGIGATDDFAEALAVQSDDRIVAAGFSTTEDATQTVVDEDVSLLRLRLDGTLDPDFGSGGPAKK